MKQVNYLPYWKSLIGFILDKNTSWKPKAGVILAILYLMWPIDLVPDLMPLFGWLDDIGITALALWYLAHTVNKYIAEKNRENRITNHEIRT